MRRIFAQGFDFPNQSARVNASSKEVNFKFIDLTVIIFMIDRYQVLRKNGIQELMFLTPAIEKRSVSFLRKRDQTLDWHNQTANKPEDAKMK